MFDPELLLANGYEARRNKHLEDARDLFAQAVAECRGAMDGALHVRALKALAQAERDLKHRSAALQCYREAAEIQRGLGDQLALAHTIRHVADVQREQNLLAEAGASYEEALEIYRRFPDSPALDRANALRGFALLKEEAGNIEKALHTWREAKVLYETAGVEAGVAESAAHIALILGA